MNIYYIREDFVWQGRYKMRSADDKPIEHIEVAFEKGDWLIQDNQHSHLYRVSPRKKTTHHIAIYDNTRNKDLSWGVYPSVQELVNIRVARIVNGTYFSLKIFPHLKKRTRVEVASYLKTFPWLSDKHIPIPEFYKKWQ
jgi:hypothetical protein